MSEDTKPVFDLEKVYDEQISPLMTKIIEICEEHKMPMIFSAMYGRSEEVEGNNPDSIPR